MCLIFRKYNVVQKLEKVLQGNYICFVDEMKKKVKNSYKIRKKVEHENRRHTLIHEDLLHNMTLKKGKIVEI